MAAGRFQLPIKRRRGWFSSRVNLQTEKNSERRKATDEGRAPIASSDRRRLYARLSRLLGRMTLTTRDTQMCIALRCAALFQCTEWIIQTWICYMTASIKMQKQTHRTVEYIHIYIFFCQRYSNSFGCEVEQRDQMFRRNAAHYNNCMVQSWMMTDMNKRLATSSISHVSIRVTKIFGQGRGRG